MKKMALPNKTTLRCKKMVMRLLVLPLLLDGGCVLAAFVPPTRGRTGGQPAQEEPGEQDESLWSQRVSRKAEALRKRRKRLEVRCAGDRRFPSPLRRFVANALLSMISFDDFWYDYALYFAPTRLLKGVPWKECYAGRFHKVVEHEFPEWDGLVKGLSVQELSNVALKHVLGILGDVALSWELPFRAADFVMPPDALGRASGDSSAGGFFERVLQRYFLDDHDDSTSTEDEAQARHSSSFVGSGGRGSWLTSAISFGHNMSREFRAAVVGADAEQMGEALDRVQMVMRREVMAMKMSAIGSGGGILHLLQDVGKSDAPEKLRSVILAFFANYIEDAGELLKMRMLAAYLSAPVMDASSGASLTSHAALLAEVRAAAAALMEAGPIAQKFLQMGAESVESDNLRELSQQMLVAVRPMTLRDTWAQLQPLENFRLLRPLSHSSTTPLQHQEQAGGSDGVYEEFLVRVEMKQIGSSATTTTSSTNEDDVTTSMVLYRSLDPRSSETQGMLIRTAVGWFDQRVVDSKEIIDAEYAGVGLLFEVTERSVSDVWGNLPMDDLSSRDLVGVSFFVSSHANAAATMGQGHLAHEIFPNDIFPRIPPGQEGHGPVPLSEEPRHQHQDRPEDGMEGAGRTTATEVPPHRRVWLKVQRRFLQEKYDDEMRRLRPLMDQEECSHMIENMLVAGVSEELSLENEMQNTLKGWKWYHGQQGFDRVTAIKPIALFGKAAFATTVAPGEPFSAWLSAADSFADFKVARIADVLKAFPVGTDPDVESSTAPVLRHASGPSYAAWTLGRRNDVERDGLIYEAYGKEVCAAARGLHDLVRLWATHALTVPGKSFFHADMHAGNVMLSFRSSSRDEVEALMTLIDFGSVYDKDKSILEAFVIFVVATLTRDTKLMLELFPVKRRQRPSEQVDHDHEQEGQLRSELRATKIEREFTEALKERFNHGSFGAAAGSGAAGLSSDVLGSELVQRVVQPVLQAILSPVATLQRAGISGVKFLMAFHKIARFLREFATEFNIARGLQQQQQGNENDASLLNNAAVRAAAASVVGPRDLLHLKRQVAEYFRRAMLETLSVVQKYVDDLEVPLGLFRFMKGFHLVDGLFTAFIRSKDRVDAAQQFGCMSWIQPSLAHFIDVVLERIAQPIFERMQAKVADTTRKAKRAATEVVNALQQGTSAAVTAFAEAAESVLADPLPDVPDISYEDLWTHYQRF
ncbi:unnamed protein product [Amoebophrya sp. A25]|nr:unnamed protein product [Amoebophrya sp. A25]|eukprot:GSA25T00002774001.1